MRAALDERTIPVFAGPSLTRANRPDGPFEWLPPATAGDVLALLDRPPARLCLIDGLFDSCPAPWHKELLLLMSRGTLVFGASSMGALRAAELYPFGMIGIGAIFRAYREQRLHGDDEVALIHAPSALDWAPLSVPMIEVRATLVAACRAGLLAPPAARRIRALVREIHYEQRDWPMMEAACLADGLVDVGTFRRLEAMHVPLKRQDALACLAAAQAWKAAPILPEPPPETCFIRKLAAELPSMPRLDEAPPRHRRRNARPLRPAAGDGA
jgi:hypothetical protein